MKNFRKMIKEVKVIGGSMAFINKNYSDEKQDFIKPLNVYKKDGININYCKGLFSGKIKEKNIDFYWNPTKYPSAPTVKKNGKRFDDGGVCKQLILDNKLKEAVKAAKCLATDYFAEYCEYLTTHKIVQEEKKIDKKSNNEINEDIPEVDEKEENATTELKIKSINKKIDRSQVMTLAHEMRKEIQKIDKNSHYHVLMSLCLKEAWAAKREGLTEEAAIAKIINFSEAKATKEKTKVTAKTKEAKAKKETKEVKAVKASKKTTNIAKVFVECVDGKFVPVMHTKRYLPQRNEVLAEGILAKRLEDFTDSAKKNGFKVQVKGTYPMLLDKAKKLGCIIVE